MRQLIRGRLKGLGHKPHIVQVVVAKDLQIILVNCKGTIVSTNHVGDDIIVMFIWACESDEARESRT